VRACSALQCIDLPLIASIFSDEYQATFDEAVPGELFNVSLGETTWSATLPDPFILQSPGGVNFPSLPDPLILTWSPSGTTDSMRWRSLGIDCPMFQSQGSGALAPQPTGDIGMFSIPAGVFMGAPITGECTLDFGLQRVRSGNSQGDNTVEAAQERHSKIIVGVGSDLGVIVDGGSGDVGLD
jgi:hypothetical protein